MSVSNSELEGAIFDNISNQKSPFFDCKNKKSLAEQISSISMFTKYNFSQIIETIIGAYENKISHSEAEVSSISEEAQRTIQMLSIEIRSGIEKDQVENFFTELTSNKKKQHNLIFSRKF